MFCQRCGANLPENTTKCPNCGAENTSIEEANVITHSFPVKKIIIAAVAVVILITGGIFAAVMFSDNVSISLSTTDMLQIADRYLKELNYEQAIVEFRKILEIDSKNVEAYIGLADAYVASGENDKAIDILTQAFVIVDNKQRIEDKLIDVNLIVESEKTVFDTSSFIPKTPAQTTTNTTSATVTQETTTATTTVPIAEDMGTVTILGIEHNISSTKKLNLRGAELKDEDVVEIGKLVNLIELDLSNNQITDITPLMGLVNLTELRLNNNQITDITPLAGLINLTYLDLLFNQIVDITPLAKLTKLKHLGMWGNQIVDITALAELTELTYLDLSYNQIVDITILAKLTNLYILYIGGNKIIDITPIMELTYLSEVYLKENQIPESQIEEFKSQFPDCDIAESFK